SKGDAALFSRAICSGVDYGCAICDRIQDHRAAARDSAGFDHRHSKHGSLSADDRIRARLHPCCRPCSGPAVEHLADVDAGGDRLRLRAAHYGWISIAPNPRARCRAAARGDHAGGVYLGAPARLRRTCTGDTVDLSGIGILPAIRAEETGSGRALSYGLLTCAATSICFTAMNDLPETRSRKLTRMVSSWCAGGFDCHGQRIV